MPTIGHSQISAPEAGSAVSWTGAVGAGCGITTPKNRSSQGMVLDPVVTLIEGALGGEIDRLLSAVRPSL